MIDTKISTSHGYTCTKIYLGTYIKFLYSEKPTKFEEIAHFSLTLLSNVKKKWKIFSNFCGLYLKFGWFYVNLLTLRIVRMKHKWNRTFSSPSSSSWPVEAVEPTSKSEAEEPKLLSSSSISRLPILSPTICLTFEAKRFIVSSKVVKEWPAIKKEIKNFH